MRGEKVRLIKFGNGKKDTNPDPILDEIPEDLPKPEFRLIVTGPSGTGKSTLVKYLLCVAYPGVFDEIFIFHPAFYADDTWSDMVDEDDPDSSPISKDNVFTEGSAREIREIVQAKWNECLAERQSNPHYRVLFIFDDLSAELSKDIWVQNLFTKGRKIGASVIVMTNKYNTYHPAVRENSTYLAIFKPTTKLEKQALVTDLSPAFGSDAIDEAFKLFRDKTDFLFVNRLESANPEKFIRRNLSEYVSIKNAS